MGRLDGQVAIVTGAARGLGRAFAERLLAEGATVVACDVLDSVHELDAVTLVADVGVADDVLRVVAAATAAGAGRIDILVNNAGVCRPSVATDPWEKALEDYDAQMNTNTRGTFLFGRAVAPIMAAQGSGNIVNLCTDHVFPLPGKDVHGHGAMDAYNASKWAINGFTLDWSITLAPHGVRVNALCMGATDSPMLRSWVGPNLTDEMVATWMRPEQTADVLVDLLTEGPAGRTGHNLGMWVGRPISMDDSVPAGARLSG
jgi:NAD(P)-dependent dehydrogenase (short-subunit alcohol dehydrogenase family)